MADPTLTSAFSELNKSMWHIALIFLGVTVLFFIFARFLYFKLIEQGWREKIIINLLKINKNSPFRLLLFCERVTGIEPVSRPWQGRIIATIRYPQFVKPSAAGGNRTRTVSLQLDFKSSASASSATAANRYRRP